MRVKIDVKKSHIKKGYDNVDSQTDCPIALAMTAAFKRLKLARISVLCAYDIAYIDTFQGQKIKLPLKVQQFQRRIFADKEVKPFSFTVVV